MPTPRPKFATFHDSVNYPAHYQGEGGMEVIDVIESFDLPFTLGNTVKYILRAGKKGDRTEDLRKAAFYLNREIVRSARKTKAKAQMEVGK